MTFKIKSKLCIGCEPLGGHNWGEFYEKNFQKLISKSYLSGINFFDTAAIYGLGKSEERLQAYLGKNINNCFISTKGGIRINPQKNHRLIVDGSLEFIKHEISNSLKRLRLKKIYLYSIHHFDPKQDYRPSLDYLTKLKKKEIISNIGVSNISIESFIKINEIYKIDYLQIPVNIFNMSFYNKFKPICKKYKIKILPYNILLFGLLSKKIEEIEEIKNNIKSRHRLKEFLQNNRTSKFFNKFKNKNMHKLAIKDVMNLELIDSLILGMSNINQLKKNLEILNSD